MKSLRFGYALQELTQVLVERTGAQGRIFEPMPVDRLGDLAQLLSELDFVKGCLEDMMHTEARQPLRPDPPTVWN